MTRFYFLKRMTSLLLKCSSSPKESNWNFLFSSKGLWRCQDLEKVERPGTCLKNGPLMICIIKRKKSQRHKWENSWLWINNEDLRGHSQSQEIVNHKVMLTNERLNARIYKSKGVNIRYMLYLLKALLKSYTWKIEYILGFHYLEWWGECRKV